LKRNSLEEMEGEHLEFGLAIGKDSNGQEMAFDI
jgi:hypothetical protein